MLTESEMVWDKGISEISRTWIMSRTASSDGAFTHFYSTIKNSQ